MAVAVAVAMLGFSLTATACCWLPSAASTRPSKVLSVVMVVGCAPVVPTSVRPLIVGSLLVLAIASAVGARGHSDPAATAHRALGAILMSAVLINVPHEGLATASGTAGLVGHLHEHAGVALLPALVLAAVIFAIWSVVMAVRSHRHSSRVESIAMGLAVIAMLSPDLLS